MWKTLHAWLGVGESAPEPDTAPLRELLDALDQLDPARAQFLARFAFLLGRVARVDDSFSDVEAQAMETVLTGQAHLPAAHAALVVNLVRTSKQMFSGSTDFTVTQAFVDSASYEERLALAHCLFAIAGSDQRISTTEEAELHRIANHLRIEGPDLRKIRLRYRPMLPGLSSGRES